LVREPFVGAMTPQELFALLAAGDTDRFFRHVAPDVTWTVMGTHPLAGTYRSRDEFRGATFGRIDKALSAPLMLVVDHVHEAGDVAVVEMHSESTTRDGQPFENRYCWVCRFEAHLIVEVRAYVDSALVAGTLERIEE
jgi:ketosteroid isomerase-like protein